MFIVCPKVSANLRVKTASFPKYTVSFFNILYFENEFFTQKHRVYCKVVTLYCLGKNTVISINWLFFFKKKRPAPDFFLHYILAIMFTQVII